jgi:hypothetical protein
MQILARELSLRNFHLESRIGLYSIYRRSDGANGTKAGILSGGEGE